MSLSTLLQRIPGSVYPIVKNILTHVCDAKDDTEATQIAWAAYVAARKEAARILHDKTVRGQDDDIR